MKQAWETIVAFKLVWFRVLCYFLIPAINAFLTVTETWSGQTWEDTATFLKIRLFMSVGLAGLMPLVAFVDQSLGRARERLEHKKQDNSGT